ncbi:hypothetical protein E2C01_095299 [Portunus trituberculatus]|uniref:Uncharacterized protein n=1 Tax=Portunus trituberculatus TaxID=210409 RepID=A0A5B7K3F6_PORTR|nr:hypothetical protein [Portunus trituberculatus]
MESVRMAAYKLNMPSRLKSLDTPADELKRVYLTLIQQLEDVQKRVCKIILCPAYINYDHALTTFSLPKLSTRH